MALKYFVSSSPTYKRHWYLFEKGKKAENELNLLKILFYAHSGPCS